MTPRLRNFSVGATVLFALGVLGWMIFRFGAQPATFFRPPQMPVVFLAERADGLGDGSTINFRGVEAGRVLRVRRDPESDRIRIDAFLYREPPLPANLKADIVFTSPLGGVSSLDLRVIGTAEGTLQPNAVLEARYLGSTFLPPEFAELARNLNETIEQFNNAKLIDSLRITLDTARQRIDDTGKLIETLQSVVGDPKLKDDLSLAMANLRSVSEEARQITTKANTLVEQLQSAATNADRTLTAASDTFRTTQRQVDSVGTELGLQLVKAGKLLDEVTDVSRKINQGAGTAGLLLNDPRLYQSLVDSSTELNLTIMDVRRLIQQWEQEGVTLKLGR